MFSYLRRPGRDKKIDRKGIALRLVEQPKEKDISIHTNTHTRLEEFLQDIQVTLSRLRGEMKTSSY